MSNGLVGLWIKGEEIEVVARQLNGEIKEYLLTNEVLDSWLSHYRGWDIVLAIEQKKLDYRLMVVPDLTANQVDQIISATFEEVEGEWQWCWNPLYHTRKGQLVIGILCGKEIFIQQGKAKIGRQKETVMITTIAEGINARLQGQHEALGNYALLYRNKLEQILILVVQGEIAYIARWENQGRGAEYFIQRYQQISGCLERQYEFPKMHKLYLMSQDISWSDDIVLEIERRLSLNVKMSDCGANVDQQECVGLVTGTIRWNLTKDRRRKRSGIHWKRAIAIAALVLVFGGFSNLFIQEPEEVAIVSASNVHQFINVAGIEEVVAFCSGEVMIRQLKADRGQLQIRGKASSYEAISDLIKNLEYSGWWNNCIITEVVQEERSITFVMEAEANEQ